MLISIWGHNDYRHWWTAVLRPTFQNHTYKSKRERHLINDRSDAIFHEVDARGGTRLLSRLPNYRILVCIQVRPQAKCLTSGVAPAGSWLERERD